MNAPETPATPAFSFEPKRLPDCGALFAEHELDHLLTLPKAQRGEAIAARVAAWRARRDAR